MLIISTSKPISMLLLPREIWAHRQLLYFLLWRDIKVRYKQTMVGLAWVILQPFITMIVFSFVFGGIAKISTGNTPYPIFVFTGLIFWNFFSRSLSSSVDSLTQNQSLIKNVYFPRVILPLTSVAVQIVDFFASFFILILLMIYFRYVPHLVGIFIVVPILFFLFLLATGLGAFFAAVNIKYRDFRFLIPFGLQLLLFLTPIIYPGNLINNEVRPFLSLNPLVPLIEIIHASFLGVGEANMPFVLVAITISITVFFLGVLYLTRKEQEFADFL